MPHLCGKRSPVFWVALLVLAAVAAGIIYLAVTSTPTSPAVSNGDSVASVAISAAAPKTPPTGAASLNMETCGCPSSGAAPTCATQRKWQVSKTALPFDSSDNHTATGAFNVTVISEDEIYVSGVYDLIVANSGTPSTALSSVVISLEQAAIPSGSGNASGSSGKNYNIVAQAVLSAANSLCNARSPMQANICNQTVQYAALATAGSTLVTYDPSGNSIVSLNSVIINTSNVDNDRDGFINEDSPDGTDACGGGLRGVNDDPARDLLVDEDGVCQDTVHFVVRYQLKVTAQQAAALAGQYVRINVQSTFLSVGDRGAVCSADVDCNGVLSSAEKLARTVQSRTSFNFPTTCPMHCGCVSVQDLPLFVVVGLTGPRPVSDVRVPSNPFSVCSSNVTTLPTWSINCSTQTSATNRIINTVVAQPIGNDQCVNIYGQTLINPTAAVASVSYTCIADPDAPIETPSIIPSPATIPAPHPPAAGLICTLTGGAFGGNGRCSGLNVSICSGRRSQPAAQCLPEVCLPDIYANGSCVINSGGLMPAYRKTSILAPPSVLKSIYMGFVAGNVGAPSYLSVSHNYTTALANSAAYATSAGNLARQVAVAKYNRDMTYTYDSTYQINAFNALYFASNCSDAIHPSMGDALVGDVITVAQCIMGLPHEFSSMTATGAAAAACRTYCGATTSQDDLCTGLYTAFPAPAYKSNGVTLFSALVNALNLYNTGYDECKEPATPCILLPATFV